MGKWMNITRLTKITSVLMLARDSSSEGKIDENEKCAFANFK
jgi:hypothetical protein